MDWFSWLSRTNLEPSLIYEYGLLFSKNELEHEDIAYFNHEFLQSMGITIAKHRLEILKLAKKDRKRVPFTSRSLSRVLIVFKKTKRCFSEYIRNWIRREESSQALVVVPRSTSKGSKWKGAMLKRNKRLVMPNSSFNGSFSSNGSKQERLFLTNGTPCRLDSFSSPMVCDYSFKEEKVCEQDCADAYWGSGGIDQIRWDSMFQDLKPT